MVPSSAISPDHRRTDSSESESLIKVRSQISVLQLTDSAGLERLYERAENLIRRDPRGTLREFSTEVPELCMLPLGESFFEVSSMMRYGPSPSSVLQSIWKYNPPIDSPTLDHHHEALTEAVKYERIQAYALREARKRLNSDPESFDRSDRMALISELSRRAENEPSLNLSLEMFQTLADLHASDAIETALKSHSPRDQKVIRAVIDAG